MEPQGAAYDNANSGTVYRCKFCGMDCPSRQSLGGHSNIHRRERAQQQMQDVEIVRRKFRYDPYEGYVWASEDDLSYYSMRLLHPSLEYVMQPERSFVQPLEIHMAVAPPAMQMPVVVQGDEELDLTLKL